MTSHIQAQFALQYTLQAHERRRTAGHDSSRTGHQGVDELIRHYNCGDLDSLEFNYDQSQV